MASVNEGERENYGLDRLTMHYRQQMQRDSIDQRGTKKMYYPPEAQINTWTNHEVSGVQNWQDLDN